MAFLGEGVGDMRERGRHDHLACPGLVIAGTNYALGSVLGKITASGKYRLSPVAEVEGDEGAETAVAVLLEAVDATAADKTALVVARGPVILSEAALVFDASVDDATKTAAKHAELSSVGLVPRETA
jgi:hypothetical protein